jgi:hypothetical protein
MGARILGELKSFCSQGEKMSWRKNYKNKERPASQGISKDKA